MPKYDVFISYKSEDYPHAKKIYNFLTKNGLNVFLAPKELRKLGESEYRKVISNAIHDAYHLIIFASKAEYIDSTWVYYEWDMFVNDKLMGWEHGNIITVLKGIKTNDINMDLWKYESLDFGSYSQKILYYVKPMQPVIEDPDIPEPRPDVLKNLIIISSVSIMIILVCIIKIPPLPDVLSKIIDKTDSIDIDPIESTYHGYTHKETIKFVKSLENINTFAGFIDEGFDKYLADYLYWYNNEVDNETNIGRDTEFNNAYTKDFCVRMFVIACLSANCDNSNKKLPQGDIQNYVEKSYANIPEEDRWLASTKQFDEEKWNNNFDKIRDIVINTFKNDPMVTNFSGLDNAYIAILMLLRKEAVKPISELHNRREHKRRSI